MFWALRRMVNTKYYGDLVSMMEQIPLAYEQDATRPRFIWINRVGGACVIEDASSDFQPLGLADLRLGQLYPSLPVSGDCRRPRSSRLALLEGRRRPHRERVQSS